MFTSILDKIKFNIFLGFKKQQQQNNKQSQDGLLFSSIAGIYQAPHPSHPETDGLGEARVHPPSSLKSCV